MEQIELKSKILMAQIGELTDEEQALVHQAIT